MSFRRPLRGGCQCGRNRYIIEAPKDADEVPQVLFDTGPSHRVFLAAPLTAFLRVPLSWYRSTTFAFFPDETSPMIHRVYEHPAEEHSKRHFCGFCGTPLSYWSEEPRAEADYIQLTLGSLRTEDLEDLDDLGLLPEPEEKAPASWVAPAPEEEEGLDGRETLGLPWFDSMVAGSRLGKMRTTKGGKRSQDGRIRVEWEVHEWTNDDDDAVIESPAKKARHDGQADTAEAMQH